MPSHLETYLNYYRTLENPGYAVLVTGEWGVGKTYQVRQSIPEDKRHYVSVFGLQTVDRLHAEVFAAAHPTLASGAEALKKVGDSIGALGGSVFALASAAPNIMNSVIKRSYEPDRTLIFDDLERSDIHLKDLLGAINYYVEQHELQVVVLAHDSKLTGAFREMKEKIFGQTIQVTPQVADAFACFTGLLKKPRAKAFVEKYREPIINIFRSSNAQSLRILRHVIEDLARLEALLTDDHLGHQDAMKELVPLFVALNIEARMGQLDRTQLRNREVSYGYHLRAATNAKTKPDMPPLMAANEKYDGIDLESRLLSSEVIVAMLCDGIYDPQSVQASLNTSSFFLKPEDVAPWQIVYQFTSLEDQVVDDAVDAMEKQLSEHTATDSGEILHVFALKLLMAEKGIQENTPQEVVDHAVSYIDALREENKLAPRSTDWRWPNEVHESYGNYGFFVLESVKSHFEKIRSYLISSREKVFQDQIPEVVEIVMEMVRTDGSEFFEYLSPTNNGENPYASIPLLHHIPVRDFVDAWLGSHSSNWRNIYYGIENRYDHGRLERELPDETEWAKELYVELKRQAGQAEGFRSYRIERIIPKVLRDLATGKPDSMPE